MLCELNELSHLVVRPPRDADPRDKLWQEISERVACTFLVPSDQSSRWKSFLPKRTLVLNIDSGWVPDVLGGIKAALEGTGFAPYETVYVTWDSQDLSKAANSRVGTILVSSRVNKCLPDIHFEDDSLLLQVLEETLAGKLVGHVGEVAVENHKGRSSPIGSIFLLNLKKNLGTLSHAPTPVYALGRYFGSEDDRAKKHLFTQLILENVKKGRRDDALPYALACVMGYLDELESFNIVVGVPPKPSKPGYLVEVIRQACRIADANSWGMGNLSKRYRQDCLWCTRDYPSQKGLNAIKRRENVRNVFAARVEKEANHVLLIDDVFTTGATTGECIDTLLTAGARKVSLLVLGFDQKYCVNKLHKLPCKDKNCDGEARIRYRRNDRKPFWGCSHYHDKQCTATRSWWEGVKELNQMNKIEEIQVYSDIPF